MIDTKKNENIAVEIYFDGTLGIPEAFAYLISKKAKEKHIEEIKNSIDSDDCVAYNIDSSKEQPLSGKEKADC